jgi:dynein heavy chain 1
LLSATELERIRAAVQLIFAHLRKIRSTKYPIQRCLRLVEAISRDLGAQLLKVLGTRRLMHIPFDEFEKVMTQCFDVFPDGEDVKALRHHLLKLIERNMHQPPGS